MSDLDRLRREYADRKQRLAEGALYSYFNPAYLFTIQQRQRAVLRVLRRQGWFSLKDKRILEIGCGRGGVLRELLSFGAAPEHLNGADLLEDRVTAAHRALPHLPIVCADGQNLPYASGAFDLVLQYTVFSSVLDDSIRTNLAREMLRVLRPESGLILWYDFWLNPNNPHTRGIRPAEVKRLFPGCQFTFRRVTLAPPITRRLIGCSWLLCAVLERCSLLNSHYLIAIKPR